MIEDDEAAALHGLIEAGRRAERIRQRDELNKIRTTVILRKAFRSAGTPEDDIFKASLDHSTKLKEIDGET